MKTRWHLYTITLGFAVALILAPYGIIVPTNVVARTLPQAEHHVCPTGPPACDFTTIQAAVHAASAGDVIKVAAGTYSGVQTRNGHTQHLLIDKSVIIQGGYNPPDWQTANPALHPVTLDAQAGGRVMYVDGNHTVRLEGLRLTKGDATGQGGGHWGEDAGGGLYADGATLVLDNCWLSANSAQAGGGVYFKEGEITVTDSVFTNNMARMNAGGSYGDGGGLLLDHATALLERNLFTANSAGYSGSAIYAGFASDVTMVNDVLAANVIEELPPYSWGCALIASGSMVEMIHSTVNGNLGANGVGVCVDSWPAASTVTLTNGIMVKQTVGIDVAAGSSATIDGVLWHANRDGNTTGPGSIDVSHAYTGDPLFLEDGFHLTENSPAIDRGIDAGVVKDIDYQSRPYGSGPDLGADEWQPLETPAPTPTRTPTLTPTVSLRKTWLPLIIRP